MTWYTKDGKYINFNGLNLITPNKIPRNGLVAEWLFNGSANDTSINNYNGTIINDPVLTTDRFDNPNSSYNFNGIDQYINIEGGLPILNNTSQLTICYWVKIPNTNSIMTIGSGESPTNGAWLTWYSDRYVYFNPRNGSSISNKVLLPFTTDWVFLCGVYNGNEPINTSKFEIYINGQKQNDDLSGTPPTSLSSTCFNQFNLANISAFESGFISEGSIDNVRIYNRALNESEITKLYNE